ncbi:OSJNBa0039K24.13 protein, related [Eimeria necatrix]|uniref:OSJNBa0039K24.13 protein, related n=1 Tax=Eimeria necatrix TaxID=51315 RepID=U6MM10_9EIME|nr:OSJNBa0039K24.13 protein, related [Eimeria necatrix]CDJ63509.1 OSJNBa0039K24.13 protein, related [Eimeria necatrix]
MAHFVPAKKSFTAADTVELLADRLIRCYGFPEVLISDSDPRFQSDLWHQFCRHFNIKRRMSSSYHPQSDVQTERVSRTLEQMLRTYIQSDEREWQRLLSALELAYNTASHSSTELSPFEVMIDENLLAAANLDIVGALAATLTPPMTKLCRQLCDRAQSHMLKAKWQQKYYADTKRRAVEYVVGGKVWLSNKHLPRFNSCPKFEPRYRGHFEVIERIQTAAYSLALPRTYACHNVFLALKLGPHRPRPPNLVPQRADTAWPPICDAAASPTEEDEADYIMDKRGSGTDAQDLIKWRGTPEDQATWEPAHHLTGCPAFLCAWHRRQRRRLQARKHLAPKRSDLAPSASAARNAGSLT